MISVPFLDLSAQHALLKRELLDAIESVIAGGTFAGGPFVDRFEREFAECCGSRHAIGVGSGTDALWLALSALGVGPGDEVITVPMTFIATAEAISRTGATPVFVDIDSVTYTMDPSKLGQALTPRTKAILPVHLFGQMANMDAILQIAAERGIPVVEDAAQAHCARSRGRTAGSLGAAGCFSFYPGKNLGALGEAGAVVTDDAELAGSIRVLRDHGQSQKYYHSVIGWNCRMDGIQAAVLGVKLPDLERNNARRREFADYYNRALRDLPDVVVPVTDPRNEHANHLYVIRVPDRAAFISQLAKRGIGTGIHYPVPVHLQKAYSGLGLLPGSFPVAERCAEQFVSLPLYPELRTEQLDRVIAAVAEALAVGVAA